MSKWFTKEGGGFTLIGVMVALFILVTASVASFTLMARTQKTAVVSRDNFVAANLAREGLELVRAVRDTNWFEGNDWTENICVSDDSGTLAIDFDRFIQSEINIIHDPTAEEMKLFTRGNRWSHFQTNNSQETRFSRQVAVFCENRFAQESDPEDPSRIIVTTRVTWDREGEEQLLMLKTRLYDWYQD